MGVYILFLPPTCDVYDNYESIPLWRFEDEMLGE